MAGVTSRSSRAMSPNECCHTCETSGEMCVARLDDPCPALLYSPEVLAVRQLLGYCVVTEKCGSAMRLPSASCFVGHRVVTLRVVLYSFASSLRTPNAAVISPGLEQRTEASVRWLSSRSEGVPGVKCVVEHFARKAYSSLTLLGRPNIRTSNFQVR